MKPSKLSSMIVLSLLLLQPLVSGLMKFSTEKQGENTVIEQSNGTRQKVSLHEKEKALRKLQQIKEGRQESLKKRVDKRSDKYEGKTGNHPTSSELHKLSTPSSSVQASLTRTPSTVHSWQPAIILAQVSGDFSNISLTVDITVETGLDITIPSFSLPLIPMREGWYVTAIPGLLNMTWSYLGISYSIGCDVSYSLQVDGITRASGGYTVQSSTTTIKKPPIVFSLMHNITKNPSILEETLGLGPEGWTVDGGDPTNTLLLALDDRGINQSTISFEYAVNGTEWTSSSVRSDPLMKTVQNLLQTINQEIIDTLNSWGLSLPYVKIPIGIYNATIPSQSAGSYVRFRANVTDVNGTTTTSPSGFYYTDKEDSATRLLCIDPHVRQWVLQKNTKQLIEKASSYSSYNLPAELTGNMTMFSKLSDLVDKYAVRPFHHWEYLGSNYNLYITTPTKDTTDLLQTQANGGFEPDVILLSSLGRGIREAPGNLWNWDLRDLNLQEDLIQYVKSQHAGVIATHGTLSDWKVWTSEKQYKIGARGHIGNSTTDFDPTNETTIASLLGMPWLTLWEMVRDKIANFLLKSGRELMGSVVGSIPLQIPYVPFNKSFDVLPAGDGHPLLEGLSAGFDVPIPSLYQELGYKSYTQVGWQLAMPQALAYAAWRAANNTRDIAEEVVNKTGMLIENVTQGLVPSSNASRMLDGLKWGLQRFYQAITSARINGSTFNLNISIPNVTNPISISPEIPYDKLLQMLPVNLLAISKKARAGITTYDKYWDTEGYRSVYFSPEITACSNFTVAKNLLTNAITWTQKWQYKNLTTLLNGAVRMGEDLAGNFTETLQNLSGTLTDSKGLVAVQNGSNVLEVSMGVSGFIHLLIAHPTSGKVNVTVQGNAAVSMKTKIMDHLTNVTINVEAAGTVEVGISADPDASMNPMYVAVKQVEDDAYEENDAIDSAYNLSSYEQTWLSSISGEGVQLDDDWYEIYVKQGYEQIDVDLVFTHSAGDIDLEVYNSSGHLVTGSYSVTDNESIDYLLPASGTYYLRVYYGDQGNSYDLWWDDYIDEWTFMVYMDGANNLEAQAISDFEEMEAVGSTSKVNIITQFDRIVGYSAEYGNWTGTARFHVEAGEDPYLTNAEAYGEVNMGHPDTLYNFVNWSVSNYPAKHYALVLWDHGAGTQGVCQDIESSDIITLSELKTAIKTVETDTGAYLNLLGFDACLMGMEEVDYQMRTYADVRVGSEETEPGYGWPYDTILGNLTSEPTTSATILGDTIVTEYINFYGTSSDVTQSAVNLTQENRLSTAIDQFADLLLSGYGTYPTVIEYARIASEDYNGTTYDFVDLYDFAYEIANRVSNTSITDAAQAVMNNISTIVTSEGHGSENPDAHGVSIYFPQSSAEYVSSYETGIDFTADTQWDEFLYEYYSNATEDAYEDNDAIISPYDLSSHEQTWLHSINGYGIQADEDWYEISVTFGYEHLDVDLTFTHTDGDIDLELYDSGGNPITGSFSTTDDEHIDYDLSASGTYYLRVYYLSGVGTKNAYDLRWDDVIDDVYEGNDYRSLAYNLSTYEQTWLSMINENGVQADEDWYEIYVNAGSEQLLVNLTFTHANGDIDIQVYNSGGDLVTGSASTTNNEYINYILSTNGTYYLRIYYWAGGGTGNTYDLWWDDVDATPPSVPGITSPSDGENISAKDITVAWTSASDNDAGVKGYKVKNETGSWIDVGATTSYTFPNMPEGDHTLYVKAYDWEGNEAVSASVSFTVDTIKPSFGYITPNASYFTTKTPTIEWTGSDSGTGIKTFQWRVDGGIWHNKTTANITLSGLQDGQHTITVWVYDWAGNIRDPTLVFTVDATPPSVTIEHPANKTYTTSMLNINATVFDATTSVATVLAEIDFEENVTLVLASGDLVYNDTCSFTDGEHTIRIYANDTQGNCNTTQTVTFTVDTITPSVSIDSPQDNAIMNASSVTVTWSGSDPSPGSGIQTYAYQLDGGAWTNTTATSHTFTDLAEGEHTVRIKVYDWAGNEEVASVTFIVDTEDPTVSIISPEDDTTFEKDRVTVEWTGSDEGSGIDHYEVRIDNSGWETVDGTSYEFTDLNDGEHTVDVRVIDKSEKASMVSVSFTVNTSPIGGPGMMEEILIGAGVGVAIAAVAVALYFLKWKKT